MYELLGICLVLASLLTINAIASTVAAACSPLLRRVLQGRSARTRAEVLFALRFGPTALAFFSVTLFLVPSYLGYEPYKTSEIVSKKLAALAVLSAIGVTLALWRALSSWRATRALLREWLSGAVQIELRGTSIPTFRISNSFPIIAVVGIFRPQLFIAARVLETLSEEELKAAIAHEGGHLAGHDNFTRRQRSSAPLAGNRFELLPAARSQSHSYAGRADSVNLWSAFARSHSSSQPDHFGRNSQCDRTRRQTSFLASFWFFPNNSTELIRSAAERRKFCSPRRQPWLDAIN